MVEGDAFLFNSQDIKHDLPPHLLADYSGAQPPPDANYVHHLTQQVSHILVSLRSVCPTHSVRVCLCLDTI